MNSNTDRRQWLIQTGTVAATTALATSNSATGRSPGESIESFGYCLNTSTIREQKLPLSKIIDLAAATGYDAIEPWIRDIRTEVESGTSIKDLAKRASDSGLKIASAIGFANWIVDDEIKRKQGLETAKSDMDLVRQLGGSRIAAPPVGATNQTDLDLNKAAERYRALLELGRELEVTPQLELWGFSKSLSRLGELLYVASESGHPDACVLPDVYHIYKGGSDFNGLRLIDGKAMHVFHMNDYPSQPPREKIGDADRVYPGDGIAPLDFILKTLRDNGFQGMLSLELFNPEYWKQSAAEVAKTGLEKMKQAVEKALG